ncbi:biotinidase-like isoform X2 [Stegodyphus dumicola]|uniref:biotinidase-like isoform X2 n=1 Tax=Stegodyphus dumicola TaxID=202533 RepID=UPI0015A7F6B0|nr:biotinidase-like isoform X2 [Stegodyphus dumicola]
MQNGRSLCLPFLLVLTAAVKSIGADIIVFPEYGIFPPLERNELKPYLEVIPDPKQVTTNPCNETEKYQNRTILYTLSCMAQQNEIVVVANMGAIQSCEGEDECPEDGSFHFNTNVVFDKNGTMLVRYYKERLFYEFGMDLPMQPQDFVFKTDFGIFATFICFDFEFFKMTEVAQRKELQIDAVAFSAMWGNSPPQRSSIQLWESWALGNNATLLAANIQLPGYLAVGSGLFSAADGPLAYTFDPDGTSKLVVATVPRRGYSSTLSPPNASITKITLSSTEESHNDGSDIPSVCSWRVLGTAKDLYKDNRCHEPNMSNFSFVKLIDDSDHIKACFNGVCCSLKYSSNGMTENFYLIVYNGTIDYDYHSRYSLCEQTCTLARCEPNGTNPCASFPLKTETLFYNVQLTADFSTKHIYPSIVSSGMRLTPTNKWSHGVKEISSDVYKGYINFKSTSGETLVSAGLRGRCYDRDPPYIR